MKFSFPKKDLYYQVNKNVTLKSPKSLRPDIKIKKGVILQFTNFKNFASFGGPSGSTVKLVNEKEYYHLSFEEIEELNLTPVVIEKKEKKPVKHREWLRITNSKIYRNSNECGHGIRLGEFIFKDLPYLYMKPGRYKHDGVISFDWKSRYYPSGKIPIKFTLRYTEKSLSEVIGEELVRKITFNVTMESIEISGIVIPITPDDLQIDLYLSLDQKSPIKRAMKNYLEQNLDQLPLEIKAIKTEIESRTVTA